MDCNLSGYSDHGFSRQECWSRLPFPSPGDLPGPGIEPESPALQADALPSEPPKAAAVIHVSHKRAMLICSGVSSVNSLHQEHRITLSDVRDLKIISVQ